MRVFYLTHINVRGTRGHVHNTLKTCEAIADAGNELRLISMDRNPNEVEWQDIRQRHALHASFSIDFLGAVPFDEMIQPSRIKRAWALIRMNVAFVGYLWKHRADFDVMYYRVHLLLLPALFARYVLRKTVVFESHYVYIYHRFPQFVTQMAVRSANGVVAITEALRTYYRLTDANSMMAPCHGSELERVPHADRSRLRAELDLPQDATLLCYTGTLGSTIQGISYEVETMVDVLSALPASCVSVIVGARDDKAPDELRDRAARLHVQDRMVIRPWIPDLSGVMKYLAAADILIIPRVGTAPGSSPSKIFDYLAVQRPIVAASTPAVDEILHDGKNALLVNADHPEEWAQAVQRLLEDGALQDRVAEGAVTAAQRYTWKERGRRISAFMQILGV